MEDGEKKNQLIKTMVDWEEKFEHKRKYPIVGTLVD